MVLGVIHGSPPGGGGVTDHGALSGLGDDDHTQYGALAQAETWAALQTFDAGLRLAASQVIEDSGGTGRILLDTALPHVTLTGDVQVSGGHMGVDKAPDTTITLYIGRPFVTGSGTHMYMRYDENPVTLDANTATVYGFYAAPVVALGAGTTGHLVQGLNFRPFIGASGSATEITGIYTGLATVFASVTVTDWHGLKIAPIDLIMGSPTITRSRGVTIQNQGANAVGNAWGLYIEHQSGAGGNFLLEAERSAGNPSLRLNAGNPPDSASATLGDSNMLLAWMENGTVNLRRVRWVDSGAGGGAGIPANTKLLYAV